MNPIDGYFSDLPPWWYTPFPWWNSAHYESHTKVYLRVGTPPKWERDDGTEYVFLLKPGSTFMVDIVGPHMQRRWLRYSVEYEDFESCADFALYDSRLDGEEVFPTWVDYELDALGWPYVIKAVDTYQSVHDSVLTWLLNEGIAPGQPFLVELSNYSTSRSFEGEWDLDWDAKIVQLGPPPVDVAQAIFDAWRVPCATCGR